MNLLLVDDEFMMLELLKEAVNDALPNANMACFRDSYEALEYAQENVIHIAFLDIDIPGISGLELAKRLSDLYPQINIIFCTGYREYAADAFDLYSSGYLMKPIDKDKVVRALEHLRYQIEPKKRLRFHCFGNFEAYCDNQPILFSLSRTKELLAYLVDREGAECRVGEIIATLFEDKNSREYYKKIRQDLIQTFDALNLTDCLRITRGGLAINRDLVECDYYLYKEGKTKAIPSEYMTQYSFGEKTLAQIT